MKQRLLLPIPFLLWALVLLHASPGWSGPAAAEYEGNAAVPIVGGNQVSARRRALLLARRDAVSRAVASLLSEERIAALEARLRKEIHARASHYVRSHRVLEESQEARRFRVKVAARLDMSRLEEDLNRLIGPDKSPPGSPPPSRVHLSHRFDESWPLASRGTAKARVLAKLKARGLRVQSGDAPGVPRGNDETLGIVVALSIAENQAIRGTGWPAIKVDIALELSRGKEVVARIKAAAWGAEPTPDAALASALSGSLSSGLEALLRQPTARAILAKLRPGWVELRVTGVARFGVRSAPILRACAAACSTR